MHKNLLKKIIFLLKMLLKNVIIKSQAKSKPKSKPKEGRVLMITINEILSYIMLSVDPCDHCHCCKSCNKSFCGVSSKLIAIRMIEEGDCI